MMEDHIYSCMFQIPNQTYHEVLGAVKCSEKELKELFGFGSEGVGTSHLTLLLSTFTLTLTITTVILLEGWYFTAWWRLEHSQIQETS